MAEYLDKAGAEFLAGKMKETNSKVDKLLNWVGAGTVTALNTKVSLPSTWNEILIFVKFEGDYQISIYSTKTRISSRNFGGWYLTSGNNGGVQASITATEASIAYAKRNGADVAFTAYIYTR